MITGHISTFPTGMFLDQYIPETPIPIQTTIINNLTNQITAILIPLLVGSIITLVTAYITQIIVDKIKPTQKQPQHTYTQQDMKTPKQYWTTQKPKDEIKPEKVEKHIYQDPITKNKRSKDRK